MQGDAGHAIGLGRDGQCSLLARGIRAGAFSLYNLIACLGYSTVLGTMSEPTHGYRGATNTTGA